MRVAFTGFTIHQVVITPFLIITYTVILSFYIKWVSLIGLGIILLAAVL